MIIDGGGDRPLRVAVAGLGTVGAGVAGLLQEQAGLIAARAGRAIELVAVSARDRGRARGFDLGKPVWVEDALALATDDRVDVVVELIGGAQGIARALVENTLRAGRSVVTANKALLAHHGNELSRIVEARGVSLGFEAAVAGGIPIIKALREGFAANRITRIFGILNGTSNYILSAMADSGRGFADVLAEAQALGYAEADPGFDVDGIDAAHKLAILASVAFGAPLDFAAVHVEGIRHILATDIASARELGYRIKLLGIAQITAAGLEQRVHPCMVPVSAPIAHVDGVFNAVGLEGHAVGAGLLQGRGAGAGPTASAVVADLIDIARGHRLPLLGVPPDTLTPVVRAPIAAHRGPYFVRLTVKDRPGVIAEVAAAFRDQSISLESLLQRRRDPGETVPLVLTTHDTEEAALDRALAVIARLDSVVETPRIIRIIDHL